MGHSFASSCTSATTLPEMRDVYGACAIISGYQPVTLCFVNTRCKVIKVRQFPFVVRDEESQQITIFFEV